MKGKLQGSAFKKKSFYEVTNSHHVLNTDVKG